VRLLLAVCDPQNPTMFNETALAIAANGGRLDCVLALIPLVDVKIADQGGRTALMEATEGGHFACVQTLIPHSNLMAHNNERKTALDLAIWGAIGIARICLLRT